MKWFKKKNRIPVIIVISGLFLCLGFSSTLETYAFVSRAQREKMEELDSQGYSPEEAGRIAESIVEFGMSEEEAIAEAKQYFGGSNVSSPTSPVCSHDWVVTENIEASCITEGAITYTCSKCSQTKSESVAKTNHAFEMTSSTEGTCKEQATETYTCSVCGETEEKTGDYGEHTYIRSEDSKDATCEEGGAIIHTCSICGDTYTEEQEALGHSFSKVKETIQEPTCTEPGTKAYVCSRCGVESEAEEIPATGHSTVYQVMEDPAFFQEGNAVDYCTVCQQNVAEHTLPATMPAWFPVTAGIAVVALVVGIITAVIKVKKKK